MLIIAAVSGYLVQVIAMAIKLGLSFLENKHVCSRLDAEKIYLLNWQVNWFPQSLKFLKATSGVRLVIDRGHVRNATVGRKTYLGIRFFSF